MALVTYHATVPPFALADETAVTLAATNKAIVPAARYANLGAQWFNTIGRKLRIRAFGKVTTAATPGNFTGTVLFGTGADANGVTLGATTATALIASQANISWECEVYIHARSLGATGTLFMTGKWLFGEAVMTQRLLIPSSAAVVSAAVDLTGTLIPSLQVLRSGSTAETMTVQDFELSEWS